LVNLPTPVDRSIQSLGDCLAWPAGCWGLLAIAVAAGFGLAVVLSRWRPSAPKATAHPLPGDAAQASDGEVARRRAAEEQVRDLEQNLAVTLASTGAVTVAERRHEVDLLDERARSVAKGDDHPPTRRRDLGCTTRAWEAHDGRVVRAHHGGVDVAPSIDLGRAEKSDVDAPGLEPVGEDLGHRHHGVRATTEHAVTNGGRDAVGFRSDTTGLVDQYGTRCVRRAREVRRRAR